MSIAPVQRRFACPNCRSPDHLYARQSRTYDAWVDVKITPGAEGKPVITEGRVEQGDLERAETTWYGCSSEECEGRKSEPWTPDKQPVRTDFQLEDLVLYPSDIDLCARCDHVYEDHVDDDQDRPCRECGCEDFVLRTVSDAQTALEIAA